MVDGLAAFDSAASGALRAYTTAPDCWVRATEVGVMSEGFVTMRLREFSGKTAIHAASRTLSTASIAKACRGTFSSRIDFNRNGGKR